MTFELLLVFQEDLLFKVISSLCIFHPENIEQKYDNMTLSTIFVLIDCVNLQLV